MMKNTFKILLGLSMFCAVSAFAGVGDDANNKGVKAWQEGDYKKAVELYKQACDAGEERGCYRYKSWSNSK